MIYKSIRSFYIVHDEVIIRSGKRGCVCFWTHPLWFTFVIRFDSINRNFHFPHRLIDLVAEDLFESFLLQVRVVGEQAEVGALCLASARNLS